MNTAWKAAQTQIDRHQVCQFAGCEEGGAAGLGSRRATGGRKRL